MEVCGESKILWIPIWCLQEPPFWSRQLGQRVKYVMSYRTNANAEVDT